MNDTILPSILAAAFAAVPAFAQESLHPVAPQLPAGLLDNLRIPIHAEVDPDGTDHGTWAGGRDFKASLHDGVRFLPGQPADVAPVDWRWTTAAVRVGGRDQPLRAPALRVRDDFCASYDLGPAIEIYDVRADGLEQSFELRTPTTADVVIEGAIATALRTEPRGPEHAPILFRPEGRGNGVGYGAAFAIDANRTTLPLATSWTGERLCIHVPGEWLATAAWPVTIDPLLSTVLLDIGANPVTAIAVERDERNSTFEIACAIERQPNSADRDVILLLANDSLQGASVVFSRIGSQPASDPQLAFVTGTNKWVFAFDGFDNNTNRERSLYHLHDGASAIPENSSYWAPNQAGRRQRNVRVGGNRSAGPSPWALFVWESEAIGTSGNTGDTRVYCCRLDTAANVAAVPALLGGAAPAPVTSDSERPSVSRDRGLGSWVVAFQRVSGLFRSYWDVVARRVDPNGAVASGVFTTDRSYPVSDEDHLMAPVVDGRNGDYLLTFHTVPYGSLTNAGTDGHAVRAQRFSWADGSSTPVSAGPSQVIFGPLNYPAFRVDAVAFDTVTESHWAVALRRPLFSVPFAALSVLGHDARVRDSVYLSVTGSLGSSVAFDADAHQFVAAWGDTQNAFDRANAARFAYPSRPAPSNYGVGCSAAVNAAIGTFLAGEIDATLRLSVAPANVLAVLALSTAPANVPLPTPFAGGCNLLVDLGAGAISTLASVTTALGRSSVVLPLPGNLADLDLHVQWVHENTARTAFLATDGLVVRIR